MKKAICHLRGTSLYQQGKHHTTEKEDNGKELDGEYEKRTWRERAHVTPEGNVFIPGVAIANAVKDAAKYLSIRVKGKGKNTYTKHFEAGILCIDNIVLPLKKQDLKHAEVFVPSDGKPGGGKRVTKYFPTIHEWEGTLTFHILDETIGPEVFEEVIRTAGLLIGIGVWRPRNRGMYGRFDLVNMKWVNN